LEILGGLLKKNIKAEQMTQQQPKVSNKADVLRALSGYSLIIILLGVFLIIGLWSFVKYQINHDYDRTIAETTQETMNLAIAYEEHVRRNILEADKDLLNLKNSYERGGIFDPVTANALNKAKDFTRNLVVIYTEQGSVILSSIHDPQAINVMDREYFRFHRDSNTGDLYIGKSITGRITGQNTIPLTRRINKPDGSFGGIVYIGLKVDYFLDFYKKMNLGEGQLITLAGLDGIVRARQSGDNFETGQDLTNSALWKKLQISPIGTYIANTNSDGIPRVLSYRAMPEYPLVFTIGKTLIVALAGFEERKQSYILGASMTTLLIVILSGFLVNRLRQVIRDSEKWRESEEEITRLDRLNTVGEMAASIGHEVRNPLTTVRGYLQHYGRKAAFADYRESFELMIEELDRANSIITEFLSLAKNKAITMSSTDLNQVIQSLVPLLQSNALLRGSNIELELEDIPEVRADDKEIRQCILNLTSNALDATPKGGTVTIRTFTDGNRMVLAVRDHGPGIPPEIKEKLGTPFLTTKENGVGLGLAVCYRIAQRHNAAIEVNSSSEGTVFHFIFNLKNKM